MNKLQLIVLTFLIFVMTCCYLQKATARDEIINTYNILSGDVPSSEDIPSDRKKLLPDSRVPKELSGVFNVLVISEHVDEKTLLYKIISQLKIKDSIKNKLLKNITDGILKIYFDLGSSQTVWKHNYRIFENELREIGIKTLSAPPDFIIISHAHWPNYMGGIEYLQRKYPYIPVFITQDMVKGLICFDYNEKKNYMEAEPKNGRIVKIKNPVVLPPGLIQLTEHLGIITQEFRHKWPNIALENNRVLINVYEEEPEYENILAVNTKRGVALFTTCMHSSFLEAMKTAMAQYKRVVYLYCGGFEDKPNTIIEAKNISPSLQFLFYHCAPVEKLILEFGGTFIKRIMLGEKIIFESLE